MAWLPASVACFTSYASASTAQTHHISLPRSRCGGESRTHAPLRIISPNINSNPSVCDGLTRLAEMATIILCTCFPMMPRFFIWIHSKCRDPRSQSPAPSAYLRRNEATSGHHSRGKSGSTLLAKAGAGKNVAKPEKTYMQISENDMKSVGWWDRYHGPGIQKTVSIELTRHDATTREEGSSAMVWIGRCGSGARRWQMATQLHDSLPKSNTIISTTTRVLNSSSIWKWSIKSASDRWKGPKALETHCLVERSWQHGLQKRAVKLRLAQSL